MPILTMDTREVDAAFKRLEGVGGHVGKALLPVLKLTAMKTLADAVKLAPQTSPGAFLKNSARMDVQTESGGGSVLITFGGQAAQYAEVQHENEDFAHSEAQWAAKFGKPFPSRTHYTRQTLRGKVGKRGKFTIKSKTWRYKRKHNIAGYRGGQAHFLFGADSSAWNQHAQQRLQRAALAAAAAEVARIVAKGRA